MLDLLLALLLAAVAFFGGDPGTSDRSPVATSSVDAEESAATSVRASVLRVVDGDTIEVRRDGTVERVRYLGIDTPEYVDGVPECYAEAATARNRELVAGQTVRLVPDAERRDDYGRSLYYVYVGDTFVNATLLKEGYARLLVIPPNTRHYGSFVALRDDAQAEQRGLWAECD